MNNARRAAAARPAPPAAAPRKVDGKTASPYGYPFWDWVAKEDPEYVRARQPLSELSVGEGKELSIKHREMVIIGILAFRGREEGVVAHMRRAIEHGATKRELLEAIQSAAVPGGGPTFSTGVQALMQVEREGAFGQELVRRSPALRKS
ncbi:MAG TPA: carboxymuconolactone decarboxylase family protein [Methylomirabilota bacterium]